MRAIPFEYTWGVERSSIKKSWGEEVKIKKIIGQGVCQILKNMGRGATWQKNNIGCGVYTIYTEKSQVGCQATAIKCCTPLLENEAGCIQRPKESRRLQISVNQMQSWDSLIKRSPSFLYLNTQSAVNPPCLSSSSTGHTLPRN